MSSDETRKDGIELEPERTAAVAAAVDDCLRRRAAGEPVSDEQAAGEYPGLMPELVDELRKLALIRAARVRAEQPAPAGQPNNPADPSHSSPHEPTVDRPAGLLDGVGSPDDPHAAVSPISRDDVPGYQVGKEISRGGQAIVFEGRQLSTGRRIAVKVMRHGPFSTASDKARFDREVQVLAALEHPGIVAIVDRGMTRTGFYYLVMQYVAGKRLDHYLSDLRTRRGGEIADPSELLKLFMKICDAVNAAHLRGIVHRDLKPSNIIVDETGEPHVLDFGLARAGFGLTPDSDETTAPGEPALPQPVTITGQFLGSLPWASPEQAEGISNKIDTRSDVYSLGVVLYQMLTEQFPYEVAGTMRDVLNNILTKQPTPPSVVVANRQAKAFNQGKRPRRRHKQPINEAIEAIVLKALSKRREDRYQTAGEFGRDVANYLSGKPTAAGPTVRGHSTMPPALKRTLFIGVPAAAALLLIALAIGFERIGSWFNGSNNSQNPSADRSAPVPAPASGGAWKAGDRILANWHRSGYWFAGVVRQIEVKSVLVAYDDGDQEWLEQTQVQAEDIQVGEHVYGRFSSGPRFYPGKVATRTGNNVYIEYDDGDKENSAIAYLCVVRPRGVSPPAQPPPVYSFVPPVAGVPSAAPPNAGPPASWVQAKGNPATMPALPPGAAEMIDAMSSEKMIQLFPKIGPDGITFPGMPTVPMTPPTSRPTR